MTTESKSDYEELRGRIEVAKTLFGERATQLRKTYTKSCGNCEDNNPKVIVPTYFFYRHDHHKTDARMSKPQRQVGFCMVMK